jgi:hypothetical protein
MNPRHNRARIAERAGARTSTKRPATVGTNPAMRVETIVHARIPVRRSKATRLTATQRNSEGRRSEWSASPYYFTDPAWGRTVSS